MCKAKVQKREVEKTNNNIGLVNLEENNISTMGPVEIATIILLVFSIMFILCYCNRRCKKSTVRSVQEGISRNNQENMSRTVSMPTMPTNSMGMPMPMPMVTFQEPGCRVVTTAATAPMQVVQPSTNTGLGLWEQCKWWTDRQDDDMVMKWIWTLLYHLASFLGQQQDGYKWLKAPHLQYLIDSNGWQYNNNNHVYIFNVPFN